MEEISVEVKRAILMQKLQQYKNTVYDSSVNVKVAKLLGDEQMEKQAVEAMTKMTKVIDFIEGELSELGE